MQRREGRPAHRQQLGGGIELHRAAAQRDHAVHEGEIAAHQALDVPQQLGFTAMAMEHRLRQPGLLATGHAVEGTGDNFGDRRRLSLSSSSQEQHQPLQFRLVAEFIQGDAEAFRLIRRSPLRHHPQVDLRLGCRSMHGSGIAATDHHGVEPLSRSNRVTQGHQSSLQSTSQAHDPLCDGGQSVRPMVNRIEGSHHCQQHLRRADVAGGLVASDVLLTGLKSQAQSWLALGIPGLAHQSAGNLALVGIPGGEESGVRSAETHRHAEALGAADGNVSTEGGHRRDQGLSQGIDGHGHQSPGLMSPLDQSSGVPDLALLAGQLQQYAEHRGIEHEIAGIQPLQLDVQRLGAGLQHSPGLWQDGGIHQEATGLSTTTDGMTQPHRLSSCRGLVQKRRIGDRKTGQLADQGLEVEKRFQATLSDLSLIGRVSGVPGGIFKDVTLDQCRRCCAVVTQADQGAANRVVGNDAAQIFQGLRFAAALRHGLRRRVLIEDVRWHDIGDEGRHVAVAEGLQHGPLLGVARAEMPLEEGGDQGERQRKSRRS